MQLPHFVHSVGMAALLSAGLTAQQYTISQPIGTDTFGARSAGQTITPSVGATPNPGNQGVLQLVSFTLYRGNLGANAPSATTFLNVYLGDPNNGGVFLGSSTNSIDTTNQVYHQPMVWNFDQLPMIYTSEHWLVMSSTNLAGSLNVEVSLETAPRTTNPYTGGTGLIANIAPHPNSVDATFQAVFFNGVMGSFTVAGTGCPGSGGQATLASPTRPAIGQQLQIQMDNVSNPALHQLALGFSDTQWGGLPLPLPLSILLPGAPASCQVLVRPDSTAGMTVTGTTASISIPVPNLPGLAGLVLYAQGVQLEATGISLTPKGIVLIGN